MPQSKNKTKAEKYFYITTTLPYVNGDPHLGHAMEFVRADVIARYKKLAGFEVFFNTGTDEHGQKLFDEAKKAGKPVQEYVDEHAEQFKLLIKSLNLSPDVHFIRTTETRHKNTAQAFWKICKERGFIYKKNYKMKYCVGCELEKQDSELVNGRCPLHPNGEIELIDEENYFFKFSAFQKPLLDLYAKYPDFVTPVSRFNEIKAFVERGLEDFSISRLARKMSWGVPVPDDPEHVMYVWFDALTSYISTLGWPDEAKADIADTSSAEVGTTTSDFEKFWVHGTPVQYCGKDNLRQQSAMWQSMLMAAGLPNSRHIVINGFITGEGGIRMSKSLGNGVDPFAVIKEYGTDAFRYHIIREVSLFEDSPFTMEAFKNAYNANLANGLGNLVSRVVKMAETNGVHLDAETDPKNSAKTAAELVALHADHYEHFELNKVCDEIWKKIAAADKFIQENEPFKKVKTDSAAGKADIAYLLGEVSAIGLMLTPIMPETSEKIAAALRDNKIASPLFVRK
jgi:methionyl-tRNA synthetase